MDNALGKNEGKKENNDISFNNVDRIDSFENSVKVESIPNNLSNNLENLIQNKNNEENIAFEKNSDFHTDNSDIDSSVNELKKTNEEPLLDSNQIGEVNSSFIENNPSNSSDTYADAILSGLVSNAKSNSSSSSDNNVKQVSMIQKDLNENYNIPSGIISVEDKHDNIENYSSSESSSLSETSDESSDESSTET